MSTAIELGRSSTVQALEDLMISADSHVSEPVDLWEQRLPIVFRDRAPNFRKSQARGGKPPIHLKDRVDEKQKIEESKPIIHAERKAGKDPVARLNEMLEDGVISEVLYPSLGGKLFFIEDAGLQEGCVQVYNDWLAEYCSVAPDRLLGIAIVSTYDIDNAVKELARCKKAGLKGAIIWQLPPPELPFTSEHYDPFWAAAQDLQMPVSLHINTGHRSRGYLNVHGLQSYRRSINIKLEEVIDSLFDITFSGVLERFPQLKIVVVENEIGWIPFWLEQCDKYYERHRLVEPLPIKMRPSEYFYRQVYATFFNDETGGRLLSWWGVDNCMWSNDYPHSNSTWPHSREVIARDLGHLSAGDREKLVRLNVARLYDLKTPGANGQH
jgi:predicted TIM-barrel fold metal-dependent hydrolase